MESHFSLQAELRRAWLGWSKQRSSPGVLLLAAAPAILSKELHHLPCLGQHLLY